MQCIIYDPALKPSNHQNYTLRSLGTPGTSQESVEITANSDQKREQCNDNAIGCVLDPTCCHSGVALGLVYHTLS